MTKLASNWKVALASSLRLLLKRNDELWQRCCTRLTALLCSNRLVWITNCSIAGRQPLSVGLNYVIRTVINEVIGIVLGSELTKVVARCYR